VNSIREGNEQVDRAKLQLLLVVTSKPGVWNRDTLGEMRELYSQQINKAFDNTTNGRLVTARKDESRCSSLASGEAMSSVDTDLAIIFRVLMALFFNTSDDFVVSFIPMLASKADNAETVQLLLTIGYSFAGKFQLEMMFQLADSNFIAPQQRLFVLIHMIAVHKTEMVSRVESGDDSIFETALALAEATIPPANPSLDFQIDSHVYSINNDFSLLTDLYSRLPLEKQENYAILPRILRLFMHFQATTLSPLFYAVVRADITLHKNTKKVKRATLESLNWLGDNPRECQMLTRLFPFFSDKSSRKVARFSEDVMRIVIMVCIVRKCDPKSHRTGDDLAEARCRLIDFAMDVDDPEMQLLHLKALINLHVELQNDGEAACVLHDCMQLFPCDDTPFREQLQETKARYCRELHWQLGFQVVDLLIAGGFEEHAKPILNEIDQRCVIPYRNIELRPRIAGYHATICKNISRVDRKFPKFFQVSFHGEQISSQLPISAGKAFIYRTMTALPEELKKQFPDITVASGPPPDNKINWISIKQVVPVTRDDVTDMWHVTDTGDKPKYLVESEKYDQPMVFRSDTLRTDRSLQQEFFFVKQTFPCRTRRVEVDTAKTVTRELKPLEHAIFDVVQLSKMVVDDMKWYHSPATGDTTFVARLADSVSKVCKELQDGATWKAIEDFLAKDTEAEDAEQKETISRFRESVQNQINLLVQIVGIGNRPPDEVKQSVDLSREVTTCQQAVLQVLMACKPKFEKFGFIVTMANLKGIK
jgi:hypothetical protein